MDCLDRDRLLTCLDGDPTAAEADHVESCPQCQQTLAELMSAEDALGPEVRQAAREPAYAEIEVDRVVALVARLDGPAAATQDFSTQLPATPSTAVHGDVSHPTAPAAPPTPVIPLPFLSPPQGPGELGRLGEYRVLAVLGHGGMGVVLRAEDVRLERPVAIKVMLPEIATDTLARERFQREARLMARVEHRHVIPIYRVDEANGVVYLVMKLLQGESLEQRLRRDKRLRIADAVRAVREAAEGLAAAHARDLVHRDIKPANLWLETTSDGGWQLLLLDFGLARPGPADAQQLSRPGAVIGTPAYMAPEQARGGELDGRCDLFSLGCVLYRMTTGTAPFAAPDLISTLSKVACEDPPAPQQLCPNVPLSLSELVMQLLSKDRTARPASAAAVVAALRDIERSLPAETTSFRAPGPSTPRPSVATSVHEPSTRTQVPAAASPARLWLLVGVGAALLAGVAALAVLLPRWRTPDVPARSVPPPELPLLKGTIDILIYEPDNRRRQNLFLDDPGAMPLRPGDQFCIEAELNRPAYAYVLWIDTDGEVQPLYPWKPGHWEKRPEMEHPVARLRRPDELDLFYKASKGTRGMETLVLLARDTPLPRAVDLRAELGPLPRPAAQQLEATAWFENGEAVRNRRGRAGMFDVTRREDPVLMTQQRIKARLGEHFAYTLAVSFANQGR